MPVFSKPDLREAVRLKSHELHKSADGILREAIKSADTEATYDVFLSHRYLDKEDVLGLKLKIEDLQYTAFVDWIENPSFDRTKVTKETATWLRQHMRRCQCLFYAVSENALSSRWMPWELGYSDGIHGRVAVLPVVETRTASEFYQGQEYLGLYPYVTRTLISTRTKYEIYINETPEKYVTLRQWLAGEEPYVH